MTKMESFINTLRVAGFTKKQLALVQELATNTFMPSHVDLDNPDILEKYLKHLRFKNYSEGTIDRYRAILNRAARVTNCKFVEMTYEDVESYLQSLKASAITVNNHISILNAFFAWLTKEEYITRNPMTKAERVKVEKKVKVVYTTAELEILRNICGKSRERDYGRNRAMIELMLSTMCRREEVSNIKISDVDFAEKTLIVRSGKGKKDRVVCYSDTVAYYLDIWMHNRQDDCNDNSYLFVPLKGGNQKLSPKSISSMFINFRDRTGIEKCHAHKCRRTGATDLAKKGVPVPVIQTFLGHESSKTTDDYIAKDGLVAINEFRRVS